MCFVHIVRGIYVLHTENTCPSGGQVIAGFSLSSFQCALLTDRVCKSFLVCQGRSESVYKPCNWELRQEWWRVV